MSASSPAIQHDLVNETLPDISSILVTRLDQWINAIELLVGYSDGYIYLSERLSDGFEKVKKNITQHPNFPVHTIEGEGTLLSNNNSNTAVNAPVKPPTDLKDKENNDGTQSTGDHLKGIYGLFELLKFKNNDNIVQTHGLEQLLKSIVPEFKKMINDIQIEKKKIINDNITYLKDYDKYKKRSLNESNKLNDIILQLTKKTISNLNDFENDPYLLKNNLLITSKSFISIENSLINSFIKTIRNFKNFETNFIVNNLKTNLILLNQYILKFTSLFDLNSNNIINEFSLLNNQFEWDYFISPNNIKDLNVLSSSSTVNVNNINGSSNTTSNGNEELINNNLISNNSEALTLLLNIDTLPESELLIDKNVRKTIDNTIFVNKEHALTIPIIENELNFKRISNLKSDHVKSSYFVVTKSKYLINFKDKYHLNDPEFVFYLPDCTLNASIQDYKYQTTTIRVPSQGSYNSGDNSDFHIGDESVSAELSRSKSKSIKNSISRKFSKKKKYIKEIEYKFQIKGSDCNKNFITKFSSHKKILELKFASKEDMLIWYNVLKEATGLFQSEAEAEAEEEEKEEETLEINPIIAKDAPTAGGTILEADEEPAVIAQAPKPDLPPRTATPPSPAAPAPAPAPASAPTAPADPPVSAPVPVSDAGPIHRPTGPPPPPPSQAKTPAVSNSAPGAWLSSGN